MKTMRHNTTKNRWYEMCYNSATEWEVNKMSAKLDGKAMDNEWKAMQDEAELYTE